MNFLFFLSTIWWINLTAPKHIYMIVHLHIGVDRTGAGLETFECGGQIILGNNKLYMINSDIVFIA